MLISKAATLPHVVMGKVQTFQVFRRHSYRQHVRSDRHITKLLQDETCKRAKYYICKGQDRRILFYLNCSETVWEIFQISKYISIMPSFDAFFGTGPFNHLFYKVFYLRSYQRCVNVNQTVSELLKCFPTLSEEIRSRTKINLHDSVNNSTELQDKFIRVRRP